MRYDKKPPHWETAQRFGEAFGERWGMTAVTMTQNQKQRFHEATEKECTNPPCYTHQGLPGGPEHHLPVNTLRLRAFALTAQLMHPMAVLNDGASLITSN